MGNGLKGIGRKAQVHAVELKQFLILLRQSVFGFHENAHEAFFIQIVHMRENRHTAHEFGNEAEFNQVLGLNAVQELGERQIMRRMHAGAEPHR